MNSYLFSCSYVVILRDSRYFIISQKVALTEFQIKTITAFTGTKELFVSA